MLTFGSFSEALKYYDEYGVTQTEAIEVFNALGKKLYSWEVSSSCIKDKDNIMLAPGQVYDLPKIHNCCNCGAPVKKHRCEYCGTMY